IAGWPQGLIIDASKGIPTDNNVIGAAPSLLVQNNIIAGCAIPIKYSASPTTATGSTDASILSWFNTVSYSNTILTNNSDVGLTEPFNYNTPDFNPIDAASPAATGAAFTALKLAGLQSVSYKGACAIGDSWWKGWAKYNMN
ncbi:MAG TPA: hypothetical protein VF622_04905, partial [Segetibacter sp.]